MKGRISVDIRRRVVTQSRLYKDTRPERLDTLFLLSRGGNYLVVSKFLSDDNGNREFLISKSEMSFISLVSQLYGPGDYSIQIHAKGRERGFRRFWDGIIADGKFIRRRDALKERHESNVSDISNLDARYTESYVGRYFKTLRPGEWHTL